MRYIHVIRACSCALIPLLLAGCGSGGTSAPEATDGSTAAGSDAAKTPVADGANAPFDAATEETSVDTAPPPEDATAPADVANSSPTQDAASDREAPSDASDVTPSGDAGVGWDTVPSILARIVPPTFPARDCVITDAKYGGVGDGSRDNTAAFAAAIADCASTGGGQVVAPATPAPAIYLTGAIELESNINLNVPAGATIRFTTDPTKYLPVTLTSFEGSLLQNYKPFVSAHDATNIAITGGGTLDGNATASDWYAWSTMQGADSLKLRTQNANGIAPAQRVYGPGHYLRPSLVEFMHCTNILLDGFTAKNSPFWTIHPVMSKNVTGHNVTSIGFVGNTDGFDPESCVDVHLDGLNIMVGDDPIAIKAGRDLDGRTLYTPTANVVIENCTFGSNNPTHGGGISIGSEMSAGVRNVYAQNITYHDVPGILAQAFYLKASIYRGGIIQDFYARQLQVDSIGAFFLLSGQYPAAAGTLPPNQPVVYTQFANINVDGATVNSVTSEAFGLTGADQSTPATDINISNVTVTHGTAIKSAPSHYKNLTMTNVTVDGTPLHPPASAP